MKKNAVKQIPVKIYRAIISNFYNKPRFIFDLFKNPGKYCKANTYYPEFKRKSAFRIWWDQFRQIMILGYPNTYYHAYGFDVKSKEECKKYIQYGEFFNVRNSYNILQHSPTAILRDKFYFGMFCEYLGISTGKNIGLIRNGIFFELKTSENLPLEELAKRYKGTLFIKLIDGECGKDINVLTVTDSDVRINGEVSIMAELASLTKSGVFLIQEKVEQCNEIASLHKESLNTIRLITIRNNKTDQVGLFPSFLRIGTGEMVVDNVSRGGIAVGIDSKTGKLKDTGFYIPEFGGSVKMHPDSKIKFSEIRIPYWDKAVEEAKFMHSLLPGIKSIGWDVAIGEKGPVFIEGNDNWEISGPQMCHGGLRKEFLSMVKG